MINKDVMRKLDLFNSKYKCIICRKRLRYKADEIMHSQIIHNPTNPKSMCPYCHKIFQSSHKLRIHLMKIHLNEKPYQCRLCSKKFFQFVHLKKHCKKHAKTRMPLCSMIDYDNSTIEYPTSNKWRKKQNVVEFVIQVGSSVKKCKQCCSNFISDSDYLIHIWTEHMKSNCLICWQCRRTFSSVQNLKLHLGEHLEEKNFKCSLCSSKDKSIFFSTLEKAKDHCVKVHLQPKLSPLFKLVCCICDQFIDESHIHFHYKQCSLKAKPSFCCAQCNFAFEDPQLYELHKIQHRFLKEQMLPFNTSYLIDSIISPNMSYGNRSVNGLKIDDIALKILSMKQKKIDFEREETLVQYSPFLIHPNEQNTMPYTNKLSTAKLNFPIELAKCLDDQLLKKENLMKLSFCYLNQTNSLNQCNFCGFSFKTFFELNSHKNTHLTTNVKRPVRCHLCLVTFSKVDQLKRHMIVHQVKEQDSVCQICFSSFSRKQDLDRHLLFHSK